MVMDIKLVCKKCGKEPKPDKERSNENWNVYPTKCECGGELKIDVLTSPS